MPPPSVYDQKQRDTSIAFVRLYVPCTGMKKEKEGLLLLLTLDDTGETFIVSTSLFSLSFHIPTLKSYTF